MPSPPKVAGLVAPEDSPPSPPSPIVSTPTAPASPVSHPLPSPEHSSVSVFTQPISDATSQPAEHAQPVHILPDPAARVSAPDVDTRPDTEGLERLQEQRDPNFDAAFPPLVPGDSARVFSIMTPIPSPDEVVLLRVEAAKAKAAAARARAGREAKKNAGRRDAPGQPKPVCAVSPRTVHNMQLCEF